MITQTRHAGTPKHVGLRPDLRGCSTGATLMNNVLILSRITGTCQEVIDLQSPRLFYHIVYHENNCANTRFRPLLFVFFLKR